MIAALRRAVNRIRYGEDIEPWDDWPMCPECWMRYPDQCLLDAHFDREPECAAHQATLAEQETP